MSRRKSASRLMWGHIFPVGRYTDDLDERSKARQVHVLFTVHQGALYQIYVFIVGGGKLVLFITLVSQST